MIFDEQLKKLNALGAELKQEIEKHGLALHETEKGFIELGYKIGIVAEKQVKIMNSFRQINTCLIDIDFYLNLKVNDKDVDDKQKLA
jgi:hypothetical protein